MNAVIFVYIPKPKPTQAPQQQVSPEQVAEQILDALPSIIKERAAPPLGQLQVTNDAGEVGQSIN